MLRGPLDCLASQDPSGLRAHQASPVRWEILDQKDCRVSVVRMASQAPRAQGVTMASQAGLDPEGTVVHRDSQAIMERMVKMAPRERRVSLGWMAHKGPLDPRVSRGSACPDWMDPRVTREMLASQDEMGHLESQDEMENPGW